MKYLNEFNPFNPITFASQMIARNHFENEKIKNKNQEEEPDHEEYNKAGKIANELIKKHINKFKSIAKKEINNFKDKSIAKGYKLANTEFPSKWEPEKGYCDKLGTSTYYFSYYIVDWSLYDTYKNPREDDTEEFFNLHKNIINELTKYAKSNCPDVFFEDGGDWDEGMIEAYILFKDININESYIRSDSMSYLTEDSSTNEKLYNDLVMMGLGAYVASGSASDSPERKMMNTVAGMELARRLNNKYTDDHNKMLEKRREDPKYIAKTDANGKLANDLMKRLLPDLKSAFDKVTKEYSNKEVANQYHFSKPAMPSKWSETSAFKTADYFKYVYELVSWDLDKFYDSYKNEKNPILNAISPIDNRIMVEMNKHCRKRKVSLKKVGNKTQGYIFAIIDPSVFGNNYKESTVFENYGIFNESNDTNIYGHLREARPQTLINNESYNSRTYGTKPNGFRYPEFNRAINEHMDLMDTNTRKTILSLNEEGQSTVLTSLTSKLYDNIINKVDDIDYGDIPMSKGDITKLSNYDKIVECIQLMRDLLKEYKQDTSPIEDIALAVSNVESRKDLFGRGYRYNGEIVMVVYCNTVLSIIASISYMISSAVEFIKTPKDESFKIALDKVGYTKSKNYVLYDCLKKFNNACKDKSLDKALESILQSKIKNLSGIAGGIAVSMVVVGALILVIIPIIKEMVFLFYYTRMRVSEFFDIQADLLQMNAYNIQSSEANLPEDKEQIVSKQMKIVEMFRKAANFFTIQSKRAELDADKEYKDTDKKYKIDEVIDEIPGGSSSLF